MINTSFFPLGQPAIVNTRKSGTHPRKGTYKKKSSRTTVICRMLISLGLLCIIDQLEKKNRALFSAQMQGPIMQLWNCSGSGLVGTSHRPLPALTCHVRGSPGCSEFSWTASPQVKGDTSASGQNLNILSLWLPGEVIAKFV